jgi:hypothetical protein
MRIIGEIDHSVFKITVFQMNNRLSIKIENGLLEQTYKFRDGSDIDNLNDVKEFLSDSFLKGVESTFQQMIQHKIKALEERLEEDDLFEEIV